MVYLEVPLIDMQIKDYFLLIILKDAFQVIVSCDGK